MKRFAWALVMASMFSMTAGGEAQQMETSVATQTATPQATTTLAKLTDWPQLNYYRVANAALPPPTANEQRVVFYGASVAEFWKTHGGPFFPGKPYIDHGIGGQTSAQMLVRFRQDVVDLHPAAVVILEGTNDIAGNTGPLMPKMFEDNWQSMVEVAKANGIRVVLTSITPSTDFPWHRGLHPAEKIRQLNAWLMQYSASNGLVYVNFYPALANAEGGMKADLALDGVHPNQKGYALMAPLVQAGIDQALAAQ